MAVLTEWSEDEPGRRRLRRLRRHYQAGLRKLLETLPLQVTAQTMAASEQAPGTVQDVSKN